MGGKKDNYLKGKRGEEIAKGYLLSLNYQFLESNFRSRQGEIDLIFKSNEEIIFVEVKVENNYFPALERVNNQKIRKIHQTIQYFFLLNPQYSHLQPRVDLVIIKEKGKIEHLKSIF